MVGTSFLLTVKGVRFFPSFPDSWHSSGNVFGLCPHVPRRPHQLSTPTLLPNTVHCQVWTQMDQYLKFKFYFKTWRSSAIENPFYFQDVFHCCISIVQTPQWFPNKPLVLNKKIMLLSASFLSFASLAVSDFRYLWVLHSWWAPTLRDKASPQFSSKVPSPNPRQLLTHADHQKQRRPTWQWSKCGEIWLL